MENQTEHVLFGLAATFPSFSLPGFTTVHQQLWFQTLCYYHLWQCFIIFSCRWLVCECADLRTLCIQVYSSAHNCQLHLLEKMSNVQGRGPGQHILVAVLKEQIFTVLFPLLCFSPTEWLNWVLSTPCCLPDRTTAYLRELDQTFECVKEHRSCMICFRFIKYKRVSDY